MRLRKGFITHTFEDSQIMVAVGSAARTFRGLAHSNETAAFIIDCLKQETSEAEILQKVLDTYEVDFDTAQRDVREILKKLREIGAVEGED